MKEITKEIKEKIFGLYIGSLGCIKGEGYQSVIISVENINTLSHWGTIEAISLSDITDEDAIEAARITTGQNLKGAKVYRNDEHYISVIHINHEFRIGKEVSTLHRGYVFLWNGSAQTMFVDDAMKFSDYLRSKGYALPYLHWSVDELVSAGIFKLKNKTSCTT